MGPLKTLAARLVHLHQDAPAVNTAALLFTNFDGLVAKRKTVITLMAAGVAPFIS